MTTTRRLVDLIDGTDSNLTGENRKMVIELATMIEQIERNIGRSLQDHATKNRLTLLDARSLAAILELGDKARLSAIAEYVHMPLSTMTGVAARLERADLVRRKRESNDGRAYVLTLTEEGMNRVKAMFRPFFNDIAQEIENAGPGTLESMIESFSVVARLAERMSSRVDERKPD